MVESFSPADMTDAVAARREHSDADALAELLLALERDPMLHFRLHPLAVRGPGDPAARVVVAVVMGGRRWSLSEGETLLAARCLRDERAFRGAPILAAAFETTLAEARDAADLLGPSR